MVIDSHWPGGLEILHIGEERNEIVIDSHWPGGLEIGISIRRISNRVIDSHWPGGLEIPTHISLPSALRVIDSHWPGGLEIFFIIDVSFFYCYRQSLAWRP